MSLRIFDDRMTPDEVAEELEVTIGTLAVWRSTKRYPLPWVKIGRRVFYRRRDVEAFIASCIRGDRPRAVNTQIVDSPSGLVA